MSLKDWYVNHVRDGDGWSEALYELYLGAWRRTGKVYNYGTPIWDEWDVLLVLDACRYDLIYQVYDNYDFISDMERRLSLGSSSPEWIEKNFSDEYYQEKAVTSYVTGNLFSERIDERSLYYLDEVWQYAWSDEIGTILPEPMTDRAIETWRNRNQERMIVHYMQPHHPFVRAQIGEGMGDIEDSNADPWSLLRSGDVEKDRVEEGYRDNLDFVLDEVERLLHNIDADDVVITADHGNLLGEWGLYGHPRDVPIHELKAVPWIETTATNEWNEDPEIESPGETEGDVRSKLEDLGYV